MEDDSVDKVNTRKRGQTKSNRAKKTTNVGGKITFSVESIMTSFNDSTEYGQSFRKMTSEEQTLEVLQLNKGAASGLKGAIKKQRIQSQFKDIVTDKMKEYVIQNRAQQTDMFRAITTSRDLQHMKLKHISVGEWVEVAGDITPGWNSEGGIGVIIGIHDGLVDVKYDNSYNILVLLLVS
jgi:hypothetical protein